MIDWTSVIGWSIAAIAPTVVSFATLMQGKKTHATFNSKMTKLLKLTAVSSFEAGKKSETDKKKK